MRTTQQAGRELERWARSEKEPGIWGGSCPQPEGRGAQARVAAGPPGEAIRHPTPNRALVQLGLEDCLFRGLPAPQATNRKRICRETGFKFDRRARIWDYLPKREGST